MATDVERLIVTLEARTKEYERALLKAQGTTVSAMRKIERDMRTSAARQQAIFTRMGTGIQSSLRRAFVGGFATLGAAVSGRSLARFADSFTRMENSLKIAGLEGKALTDTLEALSQAALKNGAPVEALVVLYGRAALAQKELNVSSAELISFASNVAAALRVAGKSAAESRGALIQLSQAIGAGIVRAEEFNAILEGALPIAQAAARGLDEAGGSVAKLRTLIIDGKVSSEAFFRAFQAGSAQLQQQAQQADFTIGQAMENVRTAFTLAVGKFDEATGASDGFTNSLNALAQELGSSRVLNAIADLAELINSVGDAYDIATIKAREFLAQLGLSGPTIAEMVKRAQGAGTANQSGKGDRLPIRVGAPSTVSLADFPISADGGGGGAAAQLNAFEQANRALQRRITLLGVEASVFGRSTFEAEKARVAFELLEAAKEANLEITPELRAQIDQLATAYGTAAARITELEEAEKAAAEAAEELAKAQEEAIQRMEEFRDASTDAMKGFIKDLIAGKSATEALSNALGRLADRLIDLALDDIFGSLFGGGRFSSSGSGFGAFGQALGFSGGGRVSGPGSGTSDSIPIMASRDEFVVNARQARKFRAVLEAINNGNIRGFAHGGSVYFPSSITNPVGVLGAAAKGNFGAGFPSPRRDFGAGIPDISSLSDFLQRSASDIASGSQAMADSVGTAANTLATGLPPAASEMTSAAQQAATGAQTLAGGVGQAGQTAKDAAGQFSGAFPGALQRVIQSITQSASTPFGGFSGGSFFGTFLGGGGFGGAAGFIPGVVLSRQHGGSVDADQPYMVGERGRELFVPSTSGHIVPDIEGFLNAMKRVDLARGSRGSPDVNVSVKNVNAIDSASFLSEALASAPGQKVLLNFISQNSRAVQASIGGG